MTMKTATKKTSKQAVQPAFENRVRFNWGFWDAIFNAKNGLPRPDGLTVETIADKHHDAAYAQGWIAGFNAHANGFDGSSSEDAWQIAQQAGLVCE
jgi:hypothetical protein